MKKLSFFILLLSLLSSGLSAQQVIPYKLHELKKERAKEITNATTTTPVERGSGMDNPVNESELPESEIHAAINPNDPNHIIVAAIQQEATTLRFSIYVTFDGGTSWEQSNFDGTIPDETIFGGGDPILGFEKNGTPYFSWLTLSGDGLIIIDGFVRLNRATSTDGGLSWIPDATSIDLTAIQIILIIINADDFIDKQWIVTDHSSVSPYHGNEYIAYAKLNFIDEETVDYDILVNTKVDGETAYSAAPIVVNGDIDYLSQFTSLDVDQQGTIHLIFCGQPVANGPTAIYYVRSTDGGQSFSEPVLVTPFELECFPNDGTTCEEGIEGVDNMRVYPCAHLRTDRSGGLNDGNLYLTFTANGIEAPASDGADVYFMKSEDQGNSWTTPIPINPVTNTESDDFFSMIEVNPEGVINLSWYDRSDDPQNIMTHYYSAISRDGGNSFEAALPITSQASDFSVIGNLNNGFGVGEYNATVSTSENFYLFWGDGRSNDGNVNVYMTKLEVKDTTITSWTELSTLSPEFNIDQIFPNPVVDHLQLKISLGKASPLSVELFDVSGNKISDLYKNKLSNGSHNLFIEGLDRYPSGSYIIVVRTIWGYKAVRFLKH